MNRRIPRATLRGLAAGATLLALASCANPMTEVLLLNKKDAQGPLIALASPIDGDSYAATVVVSGMVSDAADAGGAAGKVSALRYEVTPATIAGTDVSAALATDGSFSFQFATAGFSGTMRITVTATDWNGNSGSASVTLQNEGAIPSFSAAAGNGQVTLSWDPVPLSAGYSLFYTTNGSLPSETYGSRIDGIASSPYTLEGLANGAMHVFLLKSVSASGPDNWSSTVRAIPLSEATLSPRAIGEYRQIRVSWAPIPATTRFEVERSSSRSGPFTLISGAVEGTEFVDKGAADGQVYFYRVRPALAGALASGAAGAQTSAFPAYADMRAGFALVPGQAQDVAVQGAYAYVANYQEGLQVFSIADPRNPFLVGSRSLSEGNSAGVAVRGNYAYVTAGSSLVVVDVTNPALPAKGVALALGAAGNTAEVNPAGNYLFVGAGTKLLRYSLANPANPALLGEYSAPGNVYGLAANATHVFVAAESRMQVLNAGALPNPTFAGEVVTTRAFDVEVSGSYAYVADETASTLRVINVSNPSSPSQSGALVLSGLAPRGVAVRGTTAVVAGYGTTLQIVNCADPAVPRLVVPVLLPSMAEGVAVSGDYAFVADMGFDLQVVALPHPGAAVGVASAVLGGAYDLAVDGDRLVSNGLSPAVMRVFDVTTPASPVVSGSFTAASNPYGVAVLGRYAYLSVFQKLQIVDLAVSPPALAGECDLPGSGQDIALAGDYALVPDGAGMMIVRVADPTKPELVGNYPTSYYATSIEVRGDYAYLAAGTSNEVEVLDIRNPVAPVRAALYIAGNRVYGIAVSGERLLIARDNGVEIVDVSDPRSPSLRGALTGFHARCVDATGDYAVAGDLNVAQLRVFSLRDPTSPQLIGIRPVAAPPVSLKLSGRHAYLAAWTSGLQVVDLWP
jgi:hypothetical protein